MTSHPWIGKIRALLYPVLYEADPMPSIDRVLEVVVDRGALDATPQEYREALQAALESREQLSVLLSDNHSEEVVRAFLAGLAERLKSRGLPTGKATPGR